MTDAPDAIGLVTRLKDFLRPYIISLPRRAPVLSWQQSFRVLDHHGLRPRTIFDVGVAYGTYDLYKAYPDAYYHLIDPTRESLRHMQLLKRQLKCEIHPVALGDRDGEVEIEIRSDIQGATLLDDFSRRDVLRHDRVPIRRFDSLIGDIERPSLCKIDVQGAELMVLEGMTGRMDSIDAFIIETSTIASLKGAPEIHDVVHFMHDHGFVVADIVGMTRRPLDGAAAQFDLLFLPDGSPQRRDRRWAEA
jgi:FkbM family methyltransferase